MSQPQLLRKVVAVLDATATPYMLTGSYASSLQGQPRTTHDIDIVVSISTAAIGSLVTAFPAPDYYLDDVAIRQAISAQGQFNLLEIDSGDKVDFWLLTGDPFDQSRFQRRYTQNFQGQAIYVSRAEDTILMKLRWAEMSGGSEKQLADARGVYELQMPNLDLAYIEHWVRQLNVAKLWARLKAEAEPNI